MRRRVRRLGLDANFRKFVWKYATSVRTFQISGNFQGKARGGPPAARRGISGNFQGNKPMFGDQQMSSLADVIRAALMLRYNDRIWWASVDYVG